MCEPELGELLATRNLAIQGDLIVTKRRISGESVSGGGARV